jgi:hypothetical protein
MPISRMQNPRQLYGLGSLVKSITKGVKTGIKGIASTVKENPLLSLAALNFAPMLPMFGGGAPFIGMGSLTGRAGTIPGINSLFSGGVKKSGGSSLGGKLASFGIGSLVSTLMSTGMSEDQAKNLTKNPNAVKQYLRQYYSNLNQEDSPKQVENFVNTNTAEYRANGGRIGYASGTNPMILPRAKPRESDGKRVLDLLAKNKKASQNTLGSKTLFNLVGQNAVKAYRAGDISKSQYDSIMKPFFGEPSERLSKQIFEKQKELRANGGRMGYAYGSGDIVDQASGIMGLPQRTNSEGVKELDLRETGGFIPPVGVKEKADDIPAMLSNNEFVMTADAVRGMGGGDVDRGAQRLYDQMKMLENGGRV